MKAYLPGMGNTPIAATPRPSYLLQSLMMGSILHLVTPHRQAKPRPVQAAWSRVSGLDLTDDDDDGSHVDDFNRDDKGVHHNKEDNPFPQSHTQYTQSQNSLWTANGTDIPSSNWLKDEKRVNFTTLRDLHRIHLAHHGPSVPIQLGPTDTNNFSDIWWPRPTHDHYYPSCPSGTIRHAGPNGFHPTRVCKIPPG